MEKNWIWSDKTNDKNIIDSLCEKLRISPVVAKVLANRDITDEEQARSFLSKSISEVHHPHLLKDAGNAAKRIIKAIEDKEKIVIYGDYDVDGITSTAILYKFITEQGGNVSYYIPNRFDDGYGINILALQNIRKDGANLLVTVDCGITAVGEVEFAKSIGLDVIITDHHTCKEELPKAYALVNPKQPECEYPFKDLAGVGVAFKLILAMALEMGKPAKEYFDKYIDIVAVGTIADVVSLTDENRIFVAYGINKMKKSKNIGLEALFNVAQINDKPLTSTLISFMVAPRINAAGRVASAELAVEMLVCNSKEKAMEIAHKLEEENRERQQTESIILEEAYQMIQSDPEFAKKKVFVLAKENWHHGVIGIVASRIVDRYYRPTILISTTDNTAKGSGRSIKGFNIFNALSACSDTLLKYGGHELAAGLGLSSSDIENFDKEINKYANDVMDESILVPSIKIDCMLSFSDLTINTAESLHALEPYGMSNPQPVFSVEKATLVSSRVMSGGAHCKLTVSKNGKNVDFLGFGKGNMAEKFRVGDKIDIAFTMDTNVYMGEKRLQLVIRDARLSLKG